MPHLLISYIDNPNPPSGGAYITVGRYTPISLLLVPFLKTLFPDFVKRMRRRETIAVKGIQLKYIIDYCEACMYPLRNRLPELPVDQIPRYSRVNVLGKSLHLRPGPSDHPHVALWKLNLIHSLVLKKYESQSEMFLFVQE